MYMYGYYLTSDFTANPALGPPFATTTTTTTTTAPSKMTTTVVATTAPPAATKSPAVAGKFRARGQL